MKHNIRTLISSRKLYFHAMLLLLLLAILSFVFFGETFAFISSNDHHPFWLNVFFINYTFMGNGLFVICLASVLIFRFKRKKEGIAILFGLLLSGIVVQLLKNINSLSHPALFLEQGQTLFLTENISMGDHNSFISGHTATAFALATVLILVIKNANWQLPILAAAVLLGYSRIYLAQHSLSDILIGALIGALSGITAVYLAYYYKRPKYYNKKFFGINKHAALAREGNIQPV